MKKRILLCAVLLCIGLTACGKSDKPIEDNQPVQEGTETQISEPIKEDSKTKEEYIAEQLGCEKVSLIKMNGFNSSEAEAHKEILGIEPNVILEYRIVRESDNAENKFLMYIEYKYMIDSFTGENSDYVEEIFIWLNAEQYDRFFACGTKCIKNLHLKQYFDGSITYGENQLIEHENDEVLIRDEVNGFKHYYKIIGKLDTSEYEE